MSKIIIDSLEERSSIGTKIQSSFKNSQSCKIISPYISNANIFNNIKSISKLNIICNAKSSSTNPYILQDLLKNPNITIKSRNDIHAKTYLFKNEALITSANATPNGLGIGTIEAASVITEKEDLQKLQDWYQDLWNNKDSENVKNFTESEWKNLESRWNMRNNNSKKPDLSDLINTKSIPEDIIFCFWESVKDYPSKTKVSKEAQRQNIMDLPENSDSWDYWMDNENDVESIEELRSILKKNSSKKCINIQTKSFPIERIYSKDIFSSIILDKIIKYTFRNKKRILTLYIEDKIPIPFNLDKKFINAINNSLTENNNLWDNFYKTKNGKYGYCDPKQLYKLLSNQ